MAAPATSICGRTLGMARAESSALLGLEAHSISVEVSCNRGPSSFEMVGLPEAAVREARVRVAAALSGLDVMLDEWALTINLAPADLRKSGASLDVALAVGVLAAIGKLPPTALDGVLILGELSLSGQVRPVRGVLPQLLGARRRGVRRAIVPADNAAEAGLVEGVEVCIADTLGELRDHLLGLEALPRVRRTEFSPELVRGGDLSEVRGQAVARRALEVAAAGAHNLLMIGPPGGGKTLLARLLPTILPPLSYEEALEVTTVHSVAGLVDSRRGVISVRPFRAPHHSVSEAGLVGGGELPRPGELSLAHHGVLFLDELAEFRRGTLEALRQPLEDGKVCIARARARAWFPARPMLVGAVNPCPCGYRGHPKRACRCTGAQLQRYQSRLSGPLIDRLDVHVSVPPVEVAALTRGKPGESSAAVRARVLAARERQAARRQRGVASASVNALVPARELDDVCACTERARTLLERAANQLGLSARAVVKVLRVARTLADLEAAERVAEAHVAEAIQGRLLDREPLR